MKLTKEQIIIEIDTLIIEGEKVVATKWSPMDSGIISFNTYVNHDVYVAWHTKTLNFLTIFLPAESQYIAEFNSNKENHLSYAKACLQLLHGIKEQIDKGFISLNKNEADIDQSTALSRLFSRFHRVARQLRSRHDDRSTLEVEDEYDVQDLLHALLCLYFDDIRPEEWTPSYAGGSSRMDFLLKDENVVIEVKKTRKGLRDKDIGEQLIVDIEKYQVHPDCGHLVCFIYDPEGRLINPAGITNDLTLKHGGFIEVFITQ